MASKRKVYKKLVNLDETTVLIANPGNCYPFDKIDCIIG